MCRVSPGSPTEAQLLLVTACTFWGPQSMGLAREGLEGLGGVRLPGENGRAQWAHTPPGPLSRGARGAEDETVRGGAGRAPSLPLQGLCSGRPWPDALSQRHTGTEPPAPEGGTAPLGPTGSWRCPGASDSACDS